MSVFVSILRSASTYPITAVYLAGVGMIWCAATGRLSVAASIIIFGVVAVFAVCWAAWRELAEVHRLVNGQRVELVHRIDHLTGLLDESGIDVPEPGRREQDAREAIRQVRSVRRS